MSIDYLAQIREKEDYAESIRRGGLAESKRIIDAAKEEAAAVISLAHEQADANYKETIERAEIASFDDYDRIIHYAVTECHLIREGSEKRMEEATALLVSQVINECH